MSGVRKLAKGAIWPIRRLLDPRFADLQRRIDWTRDRVIDDSHQLQERQEAQQAELSMLVNTFSAASNESLAFVGRQIREFEGAISELTTRLQALEEIVGPTFHSRRMRALTDAGLQGLDADSAALLNFAQSHRGFASERDLWLNPPLTLVYEEAGVRLSSVNERIVEIPYAFRALSSLRPPASILDVGSAESTIPLSLAALGYTVTALDLREYPFRHPNLEIVVSRLEDFEREPGTFDAVTCISTIEHFGLGWYGDVKQDAAADRRAILRLGELLRPGGILVLTVPFGRASVDAVQRVYDDATLGDLLEGWDIESREIVRQRDDTTWEPGSVEDPETRAVAMVTARRAG